MAAAQEAMRVAFQQKPAKLAKATMHGPGEFRNQGQFARQSESLLARIGFRAMLGVVRGGSDLNCGPGVFNLPLMERRP